MAYFSLSFVYNSSFLLNWIFLSKFILWAFLKNTVEISQVFASLQTYHSVLPGPTCAAGHKLSYDCSGCHWKYWFIRKHRFFYQFQFLRLLRTTQVKMYLTEYLFRIIIILLTKDALDLFRLCFMAIFQFPFSLHNPFPWRIF